MADVSAPITGSNYTDENIKQLQAQLDKANESLRTYNTDAATDEELRVRAESEYNPGYNAQVQAQETAKQTAATARDDTLSAIERQYNRDAETLGRNYDSQRVTANNTMLARGFNNSSLAAAMLNHVETERNRALQNLMYDRTASEASAQRAYTDAVKAADANIGRLNTDRQTAIDARYQALKDAEQQRVMQATAAQNDLTQYTNNLMLQIAQLRQQGYDQYLKQMAAEEEKRRFDEQMALQKEQWEYEKAQNEKKSGGGGSSGKPSGTGDSAVPAAPPSDPPSSLADKYKAYQMGSTIKNIGTSGLNTVKSVLSTFADTLSGKNKKQSTTASTKGKTFSAARK